MASLPWIKIDVDLPGHPKLLHLQELLGVSDGLGIVVRMFSWAAKFCPTGKVPKQVGAPLADAARGSVAVRNGYGDGHANQNVTLRALLDSGWLEEHKDHFEVHDWTHHQGAHASAAEKNREKQRRYRERNRSRNPARNRNALPVRDGYVTALDEMRVDESNDLDHERTVDPAARAPKSSDTTRNSKSATQPAEPWPADLVEQLRAPLQRQLETNDDAWAEFLHTTAAKYPLQRRVNAGLVLLQRAETGEKFGLGYLLTLIRDGAEPRKMRQGSYANSNGVPIERMTVPASESKLRPPDVPPPESRDEMNKRLLDRAEAEIAKRKGRTP